MSQLNTQSVVSAFVCAFVMYCTVFALFMDCYDGNYVTVICMSLIPDYDRFFFFYEVHNICFIRLSFIMVYAMLTAERECRLPAGQAAYI